ncbi:hemagglutinin repeat-containing protein, partial [Xanthomonas cannabis]|uniref:hemagglutinin repeat-containing protein n=1 Tax=Xanthomonas cannabis TaxID=1885674 RepID=UPI001FD5D70B
LVAAKLDAGKGLGLSAGNDINASTLTTVDTSDVLETRKRFKQTTSTRDETVHGTEFTAGGNLAMQAGNDITLTAASAATKDGGITLAAGNDVNLLAASEQHDAVQDMTKKKKGTFSSKTTTTHDEWHDNVAVTTTLSGDTVQIAAGNDLLSQGAQVASTGDVVLAAGNNLTLDTVQNTHSEEHEKTVKKSGLYGGGGFSVALGVTKKTDGLDVTEVTNAGSLVGSTDGSVTMTAGNKVSVTGSDVLSATRTTIVGKEVTIAAAENTVDTVQTSKQQSAGITLGISGGVVDTALAAYGAAKRISDVDDDRLKVLYAARAAYATGATVDQAKTTPDNFLAGYDGQAVGGNVAKPGKDPASGLEGAGAATGMSFRLGIGASSSSSKTSTHEESTGGSRILSNGDVTIAATGGDLNVVGSKIAGNNVALAAANNLNLLSNQETNTTKSENKNAGGEIGVSVGATTGYYLTVSAGKGSAKGNSDLRTESVVTANDTLTLVSGNDTTIQGAQAIGNKVLANVGGDLLIKSEQDTNEYKSKQQQASLTLATGSGSGGSYSQQKVNSSYTSVTEQSGIQAGNGGFDITVGGNTALVGGAIASAADASLNRLSTGSLTVEDLQNKAEYKTSGVSVAGGTGSSMASVAIGAGLSMLGNASDSSSSTTKSDIAAGSIQIRNGDASALAGLDRSATELQQSGLKEIFDQKKIEDQKELMGLAGAIGFRAAGDIASSMQQRALSEYATAYSTNNTQGMADAQAKMDSWADGGLNKTLLHGLTGAAVAALGGGDVAGGALAAAGAEKAKLAMAGYLRDQGIASDSETYRALMELGSAAIGGALGGVAGANTALAGDQFNRQLHPDEVKWIKDNAAVFAYEQGISEESAKQILLIEAASYVDATIQSALKDVPMNAAAVEFLKTNNNEYDGVKAFDTSDRDNFHLYGKKLAGTPENFKEVFDALGAAGLKKDELQLLYQPELLTYAGKGIGRDSRLTVAVPATGAAIGVAAVGGGACALNLVACGRLVVGALDAIATEWTGGHSLAISGGGALGSVAAQKFDDLLASPGFTVDDLVLAYRRLIPLKADGKSDAAAAANLLKDLMRRETHDPLIGRILEPGRETVKVTAEASVAGNKIIDTNQMARPAAMADSSKSTLIADLIPPGAPNSNMSNAHAEIATIQRAYDSGLTQGQEMSMVVRGEEICSYCSQSTNLAAAAERSGLSSLTVYDATTGKTWIWSRRKIGDGLVELKRATGG